MTVVKRIAAGIGANSLAQLITIGIQLASLPIFLRFWDLQTYGRWLLLSAVPSYFAVADVGMVTASGNKMTIALGHGDAAEANRVFQSALIFMVITCGTFALLVVLATLSLPLPNVVTPDGRLALCLLILAVLLSLFGGLAEAVYRATGRYGLGTTLANLTRLGEWCGSIIGLLTAGTFAAVATGVLSARVLGLCLLVAFARGDRHGIHWRVRDARWHEVRAVAAPAFSFMLFPLSNALNFQGMTLLVGSALGPVSVVVFNAYRTLARVAVQASTVLSYSIEPELSRAYGQRGAHGIVGLYRHAALMGVVLAVGLSVTLYLSAPLLLRVWTHGRIPFQSTLMLLLVTYAAIASAWYVPRTVLTSTNRHAPLALLSLALAAGTLLVAHVLARWWQIEGCVGAMILSELTLALICVRLAERVVSVPVLLVRDSAA